ncbi:hypothetical protein [Puniceicoccus vermicola]|nr:hypothetical protein [Puniceicoccus vermicola]
MDILEAKVGDIFPQGMSGQSIKNSQMFFSERSNSISIFLRIVASPEEIQEMEDTIGPISFSAGRKIWGDEPIFYGVSKWWKAHRSPPDKSFNFVDEKVSNVSLLVSVKALDDTSNEVYIYATWFAEDPKI